MEKITKRLQYLDGFIYNHQCNISEPTEQEMADYLWAYEEREVLREAYNRIVELEAMLIKQVLEKSKVS